VLSAPLALLLVFLLLCYATGLAVGFALGVCYARAGRRPVVFVLRRRRGFPPT
jgi:hypothetical protein